MTTIIIGTNRPNSLSATLAKIYEEQLKLMNIPFQTLNLQNKDVFSRNETVLELEKAMILPCDRFIILLPEYNGSIPGVFKLFIDNTDVSKCWMGTNILLTGLASGRGGNARGLDHATNIFHYLKAHVHYHKLMIAKVDEHIKEGHPPAPFILESIQAQLKDFYKN